MCNWCNNGGVIFASRKDGWTSPHAFRCGCPWGVNLYQQAIPPWEKKLEETFVPEYIDKPLLNTWIIEQLEAGKTKEPEFQRRLAIWGRPRFEAIWDKFKKEKKENHETGEITRSSTGDHLQCSSLLPVEQD